VKLSPTGDAMARVFLPASGGIVASPRLIGGNAGRFYIVWTENDTQGTKVVLCRGRREVP